MRRRVLRLRRGASFEFKTRRSYEPPGRGPLVSVRPIRAHWFGARLRTSARATQETSITSRGVVDARPALVGSLYPLGNRDTNDLTDALKNAESE